MFENLTYPIYKFLYSLVDDSISPNKLKAFLLESFNILLEDSDSSNNNIRNWEIFCLSQIHNNLYVVLGAIEHLKLFRILLASTGPQL